MIMQNIPWSSNKHIYTLYIWKLDTPSTAQEDQTQYAKKPIIEEWCNYTGPDNKVSKQCIK